MSTEVVKTKFTGPDLFVFVVMVVFLIIYSMTGDGNVPTQL